jgi:polysaccharide biosynthesis protein PslH
MTAEDAGPQPGAAADEDATPSQPKAPRRRILVVSPFVPAPWFGFGTRVFELARQLATRHEVTVLTYAAAEYEADVERLRGFCAAVHVVPRKTIARSARRRDQLISLVSPMPFHIRELQSTAMQEALNSVTARKSFDVVQLEGSQLCSLHLTDGAAIVLDEHNIEYEILRRMSDGERTALRRFFSAIECRKFRRIEQRWWRQVDAVALTSEREVPAVAEHAPQTATAVVPNAVDPEHFAPGPAAVDPDSIVFMGTLGYRPNIDAVEYLLEEVLPTVCRLHPQATLTIVGQGEKSDLDRFRRPGVVVTGRVPDVRPYLARAAVTVVPVRIGGGTRLKVVEALAMGKAVVSTTLGCEGLAVIDGEHVLLADDAAGFAAAILRVLADPDEGRRLGSAGRALVVDHYSWGNASRRLEALYDAILPTAPVSEVPA